MDVLRFATMPSNPSFFTWSISEASSTLNTGFNRTGLASHAAYSLLQL
jgi:hypothetical protein